MTKSKVEPEDPSDEFTLASIPPPGAHSSEGFPAAQFRIPMPIEPEEGTVALALQVRQAPDDSEHAMAALLPPGAALRDRFTTLETIGEGGMGDVLRVVDTVLRRELAMKVIKPDVESEPQLAARFLAEAQVTAQLDHPNIVPVHDLGSSEGGRGLFFTMKRVSGITLSQLLRQLRGTRPQQEVLKRLVGYLIKVCYALEFAHARGVVHCDLKPANIMVGSYGQVYVMDWGVAVVKGVPGSRQEPEPQESGIGELDGKEQQVALSSIGAAAMGVVGTPAYMAPEQTLGEARGIDQRTDVYGLGGVLYEVLTGSPPNRRNKMPSILPGVLADEQLAPEPGELWDELPPGLVEVAQRALKRDPAERHPDVRAFRRELESFLDGGGWFKAQRFQRGDVIVRQGDQADTAYIIEQGRCEVFVEQGAGPRSVGQLAPGDVFGETAALSTGVRTASVVALEEVVLRVVTRESLEYELSRNPWLGAFVRALGQRFRDVERRLTERAERQQGD